MHFSFRPRIRHPFFPGLSPTPAGKAKEDCAALYGTFAELVRAADTGIHTARAVFVTLLQDQSPLSDRDRDTIWELFEVPVLVLVLDDKGRVIAYECEAQSGLHVDPKSPLPSAIAANCECGRPGMKLSPAFREIKVA